MIHLFSLCVPYHYDCTLLLHWWREILSDQRNRFRSCWVPESSHMSVDAANYTREPSLVVKTSLDYFQFGGRRFWARPSNTSFTTLETEDFGRPTVSPMGCRKRPLTKKRNATRICSVGDSAWFLFVCRCRSFSKISVKNSKESWPNRSLLRSSLSEKSSKKIRADETFFRVFGHPNVGKPRHPSSYLGVRGIVAVFKKMFGFSGLLNCLRCKAQKKKNYNP